MMTLAAIKTELRAGRFAWPGGYPKYFVTCDGVALSFDAVRAEWRNIVWSHLHGCNDGWLLAGVDINYEDANLYCDHTNERIESAYGEED